ncbi:hypothetical protein MYX07_05775, partial [Patescibacteria group bacterium AH-259-L07]|nr:hypothetical protein [Patescibacteria group bacterium AH-259-L07]
MKSEAKTCQNCKQKFIIEPEDFDFYNKINVPAPTFCPECRLIRRFAWRNQYFLYQRECDRCGKAMISVFSKDTGLTVYCPPCWWSDRWDGLEYGVDFDPKKPFLVQLRKLLQRVPVMNRFCVYAGLVNSEYTNMVSYLKNCYLVSHADHNENCAYSAFITHTKDSYDSLMVDKCELCYECVNCRRCFNAFFSVDCQDCHDIGFSRNCIGCSHCFGCTNLRNKQYHIFNKPYSKEEYEKKIRELQPKTLTARRKIQEHVEKLWNKFPQKYMHERKNTNVSGDYIYNSKNARDSYIVADCENCRFCSIVGPGGLKDCYDFTHYTGGELFYEGLQIGDQASRIFFSWFVVSGVREVEYSMFIIGGSNIFGSVGLKKREYCILNKQYPKVEFEILREQIIDQMNINPYKDKQGNVYRYGEFFPIELSPFGYNETAYEHFPIAEEEAKVRGYNWRLMRERDYKVTKKSSELPEIIEDVDDSITSEVISCEHEGKCDDQCTTAFKVIPQELQFYRRMSLPVPHLCPNCRYAKRITWRNLAKLYKRKCQCAGIRSENNLYQNTVAHQHHGSNHCPNEFETTY